ncbi:MAG: hypothetical protein K2M91_01290, partial [Lachnospiraceae bacterium]|nr:hypothetical protein [Lachnospiraceae bacterium]
IRTCHEMYRSSDGSIHQSNVMVSVKISDMTASVGGGGYVSHSLNQFIAIDDSYMLTVDHGDAYPRCVSLGRYVKNAGQDDFHKGSFSSIKALPILGGVNPYTGVSVGGLEVSETAYLVAGNSVQQDEPASYKTGGVRNIFVTSTQKNNFTSGGTTIRWITNYSEKTISVSTPHLVKVSGSEFVLMWTEGNQVKCVLLNASGEPVTGNYSYEGALSSCVPIVKGGNVIWYYTSNSEPKFCSINIDEVRKQAQ